MQKQEPGTSNIEVSALALRTDSSLCVRYQLAFSLGEWHNPRAGRALGELAADHVGNAQTVDRGQRAGRKPIHRGAGLFCSE